MTVQTQEEVREIVNFRRMGWSSPVSISTSMRPSFHRMPHYKPAWTR
jgi:hypothetical protein